MLPVITPFEEVTYTLSVASNSISSGSNDSVPFKFIHVRLVLSKAIKPVELTSNGKKFKPLSVRLAFVEPPKYTFPVVALTARHVPLSKPTVPICFCPSNSPEVL